MFKSVQSGVSRSEKKQHPPSSGGKHEEKDSMYLGQVVQKLQKHPDYAKLPLLEVKQEARKLTDTKLLKGYFSAELQSVQMSVLQATGEDHAQGVCINEASAEHSPGARATTPVHSMASFPVKLHLTALPHDQVIQGNDYASMLEERYGPMHAALQVGHTMIEWTSHSLVIPHRNVPREPLIKRDVTQYLDIAAELRVKAKEYRGSQRTSITGEIDLMFKISESIVSLIEKVIQVIATWNRFKYFNPYIVNSKHFVQNVIAALGIKELPFLNPSLRNYVGQLKQNFKAATNDMSFGSHAELDNYVQQRIGEMRTDEMEYLLTEYYRFHVASREALVHAANTDSEWNCDEPNCLMQRLESAIAGKELLIASLQPLS